MASLRKALASIGEPASSPLALWGSFRGRTPHSLRMAMAGMTDPKIATWLKVGVALKSENTSLSEEAQGVATDGKRWYVSSNNTKTVVAFNDPGKRVKTFAPNDGVLNAMWVDAGKPNDVGGDKPWRSALVPRVVQVDGLPVVVGWDPHFGAPGYFDGAIHVPVQGPRGVWRFASSTGGDQIWRKAEALPEDDLFPWCAVHPVTGVLYTSNYRTPPALRAYDRVTLDWLKDEDIPLGDGPMYLDRVQGGTFTVRGRIILVRCDYNALFCFSSLSGHRFGSMKLGDFGSAGSEAESVTVRSWQFDGIPAHVHVLELDNDWSSKDDLYVHSYRVHDPDRL
jgi:hypothetical protein